MIDAVDYRSTASGSRLIVADDGIGLASTRKTQPGLGTSIVNALARHLHAEVETSSGSAGTRMALVHVDAGNARAPLKPAETLV